MAYVESVGLIVSLFSLPLLGFLLGKRFTVARLAAEQDRADEVRDIHELIQHNSEDVSDQVRSIYQVIDQIQNNNPRTTT